MVRLRLSVVFRVVVEFVLALFLVISIEAFEYRGNAEAVCHS